MDRQASRSGGIADGLRNGFLSALPEAAAARLLAEAIRINVPAGAVIYRQEDRPQVLVVVDGLLRVFLTSSDGRQVTVRYARSGDVVGLILVIGGPALMSIETMTSACVLALRVETLRALLATDPGVARACAEELTRQLHRALDDIAEQAFMSVRGRLTRQLLLLAEAGPGSDLVVRVGHQELADAIGSVREVVTRSLHELHADGLIDLSRDTILVTNPHRMATEAGVRAAGEDPVAAAPR